MAGWVCDWGMECAGRRVCVLGANGGVGSHLDIAALGAASLRASHTFLSNDWPERIHCLLHSFAHRGCRGASVAWMGNTRSFQIFLQRGTEYGDEFDPGQTASSLVIVAVEEVTLGRYWTRAESLNGLHQGLAKAKRGCFTPSITTSSVNMANGRTHKPRSPYSAR